MLEIGCGTGRVLIPSARAGIDVVGLDASPRMLAVCRERLQHENVAVQSRVELVQADMRAFELCAPIHIGHTAVSPVPASHHRRRATVVPHEHSKTPHRGRSTDPWNLFNPSLEALASRQEGQEVGDEPEFSTPGGRRVVRRHRTVAHDRFNQVSHVELIYHVTHPDGREERLVHAFPMRYLFRFEVEHLLVRCGFDVEHLYAGFDKSAYGSRYPGELIFVARKTTENRRARAA